MQLPSPSIPKDCYLMHKWIIIKSTEKKPGCQVVACINVSFLPKMCFSVFSLDPLFLPCEPWLSSIFLWDMAAPWHGVLMQCAELPSLCPVSSYKGEEAQHGHLSANRSNWRLSSHGRVWLTRGAGATSVYSIQFSAASQVIRASLASTRRGCQQALFQHHFIRMVGGQSQVTSLLA